MNEIEKLVYQAMGWDERAIEHWTCKDCRTFLHPINKDYYMVKDEIWQKYGVGRGMLCISCLEKRMGRKLVAEDFTECVLNLEWNEYVKQLKTE